MGASSSQPEEEATFADTFSEDEYDENEDPINSKSAREIQEQAIVAELNAALIDITAGPPEWNRSQLLEKPSSVTLIISSSPPKKVFPSKPRKKDLANILSLPCTLHTTHQPQLDASASSISEICALANAIPKQAEAMIQATAEKDRPESPTTQQQQEQQQQQQQPQQQQVPS